MESACNGGKARTMSDYSDSDLNLAQLLQVKASPAAKGFHAFWHAAYATVQDFRPEIKLKDTQQKVKNWQVMDVYYSSSNDLTIGGWLLLPIDKPPARGFIVGHGTTDEKPLILICPLLMRPFFFPAAEGWVAAARLLFPRIRNGMCCII